MQPMQEGGLNDVRGAFIRNGVRTTHGNATGSSSAGRPMMQAMMSAGMGLRERSDSQDSHILPRASELENSVMSHFGEEKQKESAINEEQGSGQRKRSWLLEESNVFIKEGLTKKESQAQKYKLDEWMKQLHSQIESIFSKGERAKTFGNKITIFETMKGFGQEICELMNQMVNIQDEKAALQYQVIQLQAQLNTGGMIKSNMGSPATNTYLQAAMTARNATSRIVAGKSLPVPELPNSLRHALAERIIIFKAKEKGIAQTKAEQEEFRRDINNAIGEDLMEEVDVIRPTRHGGNTLIFQSEQACNKALEVFRNNERKQDVSEEMSCLVAPKKKFAKVVCRDPPTDTSLESVLSALYGRNNTHLCQVPSGSRSTRIIKTRFGWVFEMTSLEAAAVQAQGGRTRLGNARELRVEEYIPLQQCYNCCSFGHNAKDCLATTSSCRLCGKIGHSGWDCPEKDNREHWRCANCIQNNEKKGLQLPIDHAAAQLHKCPYAQNQREVRKAQLAAAGIYTTPILNINSTLENIGIKQMNESGQQ